MARRDEVINIKIDKESKEKIRKAAERLGWTMSDYIRVVSVLVAEKPPGEVYSMLAESFNSRT